MAKIIKLEQVNIRQCGHCKKYVQYEKSDVKGDYEFGPFGTSHWSYVECPNCGHQIQW